MLWDLGDRMRKSQQMSHGNPRRKNRVNGKEEIFEETVTETSPELLKQESI